MIIYHAKNVNFTNNNKTFMQTLKSMKSVSTHANKPIFKRELVMNR